MIESIPVYFCAFLYSLGVTIACVVVFKGSGFRLNPKPKQHFTKLNPRILFPAASKRSDQNSQPEWPLRSEVPSNVRAAGL